jgi:maltokinase
MPEVSTRVSPTHSSTSAPKTPVADADSALLGPLVPLLREWLPRQRWFAGKGQPITGFSLVSATELLPCGAGGAAPGLLHLLVRAQQSEPQAHAGAGDCYQLLLGIRGELPPHLAHTLIGRPTEGPLHGHTVYEALQDARLARLLLERLRVPGCLGSLRFVRAPSTTIPSGLTPRPLTAEQSNSSVVYGDAFILKVFRRVGSGVNPDLELSLALARAGCDRVPHPTAWFETTDDAGQWRSGTAEPMTLGVLQPFLAGSTDGWQLALDSLAAGDDFTSSAHALGRATAEVHTALASALPTAVLRRQQIELLASDMTERLEATAAAVPALYPYRGPLHAAFTDLAELGRRGRTWPAQRIHGDLHLGQTLCTGRDGRWTLIDFEGEPAKPIAERRRLQPVARDIAGMLRSFDYAARSHRPAQESSEWAQEWAARNRAAYCEGYAKASGLDPREEPELMRAYETDKAVYEVLYEARHRPDWMHVPMAAIHRLAGLSGGRPAPSVAGTAPGTMRTRPAPDGPTAGEPRPASYAGTDFRSHCESGPWSATGASRPAPEVPPAPPA